MRTNCLTTCAVFMWCMIAPAAELVNQNTPRTVPRDDSAAVKSCSDKYIAYAKGGDREGLAKLLHPDYKAVTLMELVNGAASRAEAISYWYQAGPTVSLPGQARRKFTYLVTKTESIRVWGSTAIEIGTLSATRDELGKCTSDWENVRYTRVWIDEGKGWQLVHEQY